MQKEQMDGPMAFMGRISLHQSENMSLNGCIRTQNEVITSLYPMIPLGTKILVISSNKSFEVLAKENGAIQ